MAISNYSWESLICSGVWDYEGSGYRHSNGSGAVASNPFDSDPNVVVSVAGERYNFDSTSKIETIAANTLGVAYHQDGTLLGANFYGESTNLITGTEDIDSSADGWFDQPGSSTSYGPAHGIDIADNDTDSPFGVSTAARCFETNNSHRHILEGPRLTSLTTTGVNYVVQSLVKSGPGSAFYQYSFGGSRALFDFSDMRYENDYNGSSVVGHYEEDVADGTGFTHIIAVLEMVQSQPWMSFARSPDNTPWNDTLRWGYPVYQGSNSNYHYKIMPSLAEGDIPCPVVPTYGSSTATRGEDRVSISASNVGGLDGSWSFYVKFRLEYDQPAGGNSRIIFSAYDSSSNYVEVGINSSGKPFVYVRSGGGEAANLVGDTDPVLGTDFFIAGRIKANDFAASFNGDPVKTDTSGALPTVDPSTVWIGASNVSGYALHGAIKALQIYDGGEAADSALESPTFGVSDATGSIDAQETGSDSTSILGSTNVSGTLSATEIGDDGLAGVGSVGISADFSSQEAGADAASFSSSVAVSTSVSVSEVGQDTSGVSGSIEVSVDLNSAETGQDSAQIQSETEVSGSISVQEVAEDTSTISGNVSLTGGLIVSEVGDDTASVAASVSISGSVGASEVGQDTPSFSGVVVEGRSGILATVETASDTFDASAVVSISGSQNVSEDGSDSTTITGAIEVGGSLSASESGSDSLAISGDIDLAGILTASESGSDSSDIAGSVETSVEFNPVETGSDTASILGSADDVPNTFVSISTQESGSDSVQLEAQAEINVDLSVAEINSDSASVLSSVDAGGDLSVVEVGTDSSGIVVDVEISANLGAQETGGDVASVSSEQVQSLSIDAVETGQDTCASTGAVEVNTVVSGIENDKDTAAIESQVSVQALVAAMETNGDTASIRSAGLSSRRYRLPTRTGGGSGGRLVNASNKHGGRLISPTR